MSTSPGQYSDTSLYPRVAQRGHRKSAESVAMRFLDSDSEIQHALDKTLY